MHLRGINDLFKLVTLGSYSISKESHGRKLEQGKKLGVVADAVIMEEYCLLTCSSWFSHPDFL